MFILRQGLTIPARQTIVMRMDVSDENLALSAAGGDMAAFSSLLERHYDRLFALCFRLTGQNADAEDLTQDICSALPGKLGGFRGESKFATWLYRVAVNASHDRRRRAETHVNSRNSLLTHCRMILKLSKCKSPDQGLSMCF